MKKFTSKELRRDWLEFESDTHEVLHVRIDRERKIPATVLLKLIKIYFLSSITFSLTIAENEIVPPSTTPTPNLEVV